MRVIKLALLSIFFLFVVATAMSLLIPSHIRISKAINLSTGKDSVFALIRNRERWPEWHPAFMPHEGPAFPAIDVASTSENDSEIVMQLQQENKTPVINGWRVYYHANIDSLTLQWYMDFHLKWYPWQKFGSLFYENTYGVMMQEGLENIRKSVQSSKFGVQSQ